MPEITEQHVEACKELAASEYGKYFTFEGAGDTICDPQTTEEYEALSISKQVAIGRKLIELGLDEVLEQDRLERTATRETEAKKKRRTERKELRKSKAKLKEAQKPEARKKVRKDIENGRHVMPEPAPLEIEEQEEEQKETKLIERKEENYIRVAGHKIPREISESDREETRSFIFETSKAIDRTEKGIPRSTRSNLFFILINSPVFKGRIWYDEFTRARVFVGQRPWKKYPEADDITEWTDADTVELAMYIESCGMNMSKTELDDVVLAVSMRNKFSRLSDYFEHSISPADWDGVPRIATMFADCLGAEATEVNAMIAEKTVLGAIERALNNSPEGSKVEAVPILAGAQGAGKSTFWRNLCPRPEWFTDSKVNMTSKDGYSILGGSFIFELAELASMTRATSEDIKSFLSSQADKYRPAYARNEVRFVRHNIFVGSVNDDGNGFLKDPTGNRRFKVVQIKQGQELGVSHLNSFMSRDYINQIWAEGLALRAQGAKHWYNETEERQTAEVTEKFVKRNPLDDLALVAATTPKPATWEVMDGSTKRLYLDSIITGTVDKSELTEPPAPFFTAREVCEWLNLSQHEKDRALVPIGRALSKSPLLKKARKSRAGQQVRGFAFVNEEARLAMLEKYGAGSEPKQKPPKSKVIKIK